MSELKNLINYNSLTFYHDQLMQTVVSGLLSKAKTITYSSLVILRDSANLIPGQYYRIGDYMTTTAQDFTQSAEHPFDIVVLAISTDQLAECAYATHRDGDTYFQNAHLEAWELKYCLDNDTKRFAWATPEGKGVIYYMKDEYGNQCSYDFKNIQFASYKITAMQTVPVLVGIYAAYMQGKTKFPSGATIDNTAVYRYTFDFYSDNISTDATVYQATRNILVRGNTIGSSWINNKQLVLNNIVLGGNRLSSCYDNTFGCDCRNIRMGLTCWGNSFGVNCTNCVWGDNCHSNTWGDSNAYNVWGSYCNNNTWGNDCWYNTWGSSNSRNIWGNANYSNTWGDSNAYNVWGSCCDDNTWGNECWYNTWGSSNSHNIWGNTNYSNTWGNFCSGITWGNFCCSNSWGNSNNKTEYDDPDGIVGTFGIGLSIEEVYKYGENGEVGDFVRRIYTVVNEGTSRDLDVVIKEGDDFLQNGTEQLAAHEVKQFVSLESVDKFDAENSYIIFKENGKKIKCKFVF